jgi:hypothetical protein
MTHPILSGPVLQNPLDEFDPNNRDKGAPPWASYCPNRSPKFKTHGNRGFAINSIHNHGYGVLYKFEDGRWVETARIESRAFKKTRCDACSGNLLTKDETRYDYNLGQYVKTGRKVNDGTQVFEKRRGKIVSPERVLTLCHGCRKGLGY